MGFLWMPHIHVVFIRTDLKSEMMAVNILNDTLYFLALQNRSGFETFLFLFKNIFMFLCQIRFPERLHHVKQTFQLFHTAAEFDVVFWPSHEARNIFLSAITLH